MLKGKCKDNTIDADNRREPLCSLFYVSFSGDKCVNLPPDKQLQYDNIQKGRYGGYPSY